MVIYEVNLTISNEIFNEYYPWLVEHIEEMLQFPGFQKADVSEEKNPEADNKVTKVTVHYTIESEDDLNNYLTTYAPGMREATIKKFGDKFSVFRRIFFQKTTIKPKAKM